MVSAQWVDERSIGKDRSALLKFVAATCRERALDPRKQLAISITLHSLTRQGMAADIFGLDWAVRCGKESWLDEEIRAEAGRQWHRRPTNPPDWPFAILAEQHVAWLAPSDALPDRVIDLWNQSMWWELRTRTPFAERPPDTFGLLTCLLGTWRLWIPVPPL